MESSSSALSPFVIVIDGGSTGSRLHIYEFVQQHENNNNNINNTTSATILQRVGSMRTEGPLSDFSHFQINTTRLLQHILPCLEFAAQHVPRQYHSSTRISYQATAGMRLLPLAQQEHVYTTMKHVLATCPHFVFAIENFDVATLSGELEGYYGVLAVNYLQKSMTTDLELIVSDDDDDDDDDDELSFSSEKHVRLPIGALDMGGSSTQIVYATKTQQQQQRNEEEKDTLLPTTRFHPDDFFATSYLNYGVDPFRERLYDLWIQEHIMGAIEKEQTTSNQSSNQSNNNKQCASHLIENPCAFVGYQHVYRDYTFLGTGQAHQCRQQVQRLLFHPDEHDRFDLQGTHVANIAHPPIHNNDGNSNGRGQQQQRFMAMSLYFFVLDSLRELSTGNATAHMELNQSWPTPSIRHLHDALDGLCSRSWHDDLQWIQDTAHAFTRPQILPQRCLESVYLVSLLKDGFGFDMDSRDITFTFLIDDSEVEWTLGMALAIRAKEKEREQQRETQQVDESAQQEAETCLASESENRKQHDDDGESEPSAPVNETFLLEISDNNNNKQRSDGDDDIDDEPFYFYSLSVFHSMAERYFAVSTVT
jgi:hypothetical protein